jgi:hypothetical protein
MDTKRLAHLSEDEVIAEVRKNLAEARETASLLVDAAALVVRGGRMQKRSEDEIFGDVFATIAKVPQIDVTTAEGLSIAAIVAEFAVRGPLA